MKQKTTNTIHVQRAIHRLTQSQLACAVGCSRQTIYAYENNKIEPGLILSLKIIHYLNELKIDAGMDTIIIEDLFKLP